MRRPRALARALACFAAVLVAPSVLGTEVPRIARLYSTQDGLTQFVEIRLVDVPGAVAKKIASVQSLDARGRSFRSQSVELALASPARTVFTFAIDALCRVSCDFAPYGDTVADGVAFQQIMPIGGGTILLVGPDGVADRWTYPPLPVDGSTMLDRDAGAVPAEFRRQGAAPIPVDAPGVLAFEYTNDATGDYFLTSNADEIELLDAGDVPDWRRTDISIFALVRPSRGPASTSTGAHTVPLCRLLLGGAAGAVHFFTASPAECAALRAAGAILESEAILHVADPDPLTGDCPVVPVEMADGSTSTYTTRPIHRFWDGNTTTPRHRLVAYQNTLDEMIARDWIAEGFGPRGVTMCM